VKSWKLVAASLLAVCIVAAGCGGDDDGDDNAATGGASKAQLEGEIETWIMDPGTPELQDVFKGYVRDFQAAHPGTKVSLQFVPWAQAHDKFTTAIAGGKGPDVAEMGTTWTPEFASLGALSEVPATEGEYVSSLIEAGSVDGTAYGRPWYAGARAFIYRTDVFEDLGLQAPESWDDVQAAAAKIKAEGGDIDAIGVTGLTEHYYLPTVWQNGGQIAEEADGSWKSDMSQPQAVEAIDFYTGLYREGYAPKAAITWEEPDARTAFINGKLAMMWAGPWDYDAIVTEKPELEDKIGVTLVPAGPSGDRSAFAGGSHLVTFEESDNPDLASAFVDFLLEPEQVNSFTGKIGFLPGTVAGIEASGMLDDPVKAPFAEQLKDHSQVYPPSPKWGALEGENIFDGAVQSVMQGKESPQEAMQAVSEKMDAELSG
jgi:N,N'-diacetylchitobiose transport system substrate-binding protein